MLAANDAGWTSEHSVVSAGMKYWEGLSSNGALPRRTDFDPAAIPSLLPFAIMIDVKRSPLDFYVRIAGQHFVDNYGDSPARHSVSELVAGNPTIKFLADNLKRCMQLRQPLVTDDRFIGADDLSKRTVGVVLPLADDEDEVTHLLWFSLYLNRQGQRITP